MCQSTVGVCIKKFVNSNQNTVRQSTFFSTKRKPRNLKLCMAKPTEEEKSKYKHDENVYSFMTGTQNIENKSGPKYFLFVQKCMCCQQSIAASTV